MTRGSECHIPEWAELLGASVPETACDRQLRTLRDRQGHDRAESAR
ncbi:MAG: hypothetical protein ABEH80_03440 [Halobaculum sp.]|jgi:hypothetical protein